MSTSVTLKSLFQALQKEMISNAELSRQLDHPTDKGDNTEISWVDWFIKYLPNRYEAAKATIIDCNSKISNQIDVVIYDRQYSYLVCNHNGILYIPAESVYAVFEVKQNLNKAHMEYAGDKAESVRNLHRTSAPIPHAGGEFPPKTPHRIIAGILTTNSDWKKPFSVPFMNCISKYSDLQQIDCGCVLNGGAFYYDYKNRMLKTSSSEDSLVYFFLQLLIDLQKIGTVPAIDLNEYIKALTINEEKK
ncbi:MAG: hypothetical protein J6O50_11415 [Ruminiclostridium sp.]|nr:hypothetical protein [Ruminiclostridium sp.]